MTWDAPRAAFRSRESTDGLRTLLVVPTFVLELRRSNGLLAAVDLRGRTLEESRTWLADALCDARGGSSLTLARPEYDIPDAPGGPQAALVPDPEALEELAWWYQNTNFVLESLLSPMQESGPALCWPHHFDLATLLTLRSDGAAGNVRTVGAGLSPGDASRPEPYFYVNGTPRPAPDALPEFDGPGEWNRDGWVGAVLPAEAVVEEQSAREQAALVAAFIANSIATLRELVQAIP
jgi:hypothetical protein